MGDRTDTVMKMIPALAIVLTSIFNFDEYLDVFSLLFYQVLPIVIVLLTIYTIWGIVNDMKREEDDREVEELSRLEEV